MRECSRPLQHSDNKMLFVLYHAWIYLQWRDRTVMIKPKCHVIINKQGLLSNFKMCLPSMSQSRVQIISSRFKTMPLTYIKQPKINNPKHFLVKFLMNLAYPVKTKRQIQIYEDWRLLHQICHKPVASSLSHKPLAKNWLNSQLRLLTSSRSQNLLNSE